jgi:hypothetical protein
VAAKPTNRITNRQRFAAVMERCRDLVAGFCDTQLRIMFEKSGGALLEFAERAESNAVQSRFFDAMSQLSRRRADIEHVFRGELNQGFDQLGAARPSSDPVADSADLDDMELSLVEPDEMEERVAAENMVLAANANYFPELYALSQRLGAIHGGTKLKDQEIPGGPHHLVSAYRRALEGLDVDVKVKVILYALFDKFVLKAAKPTYEGYNALLIEAGVIPNLKPVHLRQDQKSGGPPPRRRPVEPPGESSEPRSLGAELFDSILDLMSNRRTVQGAAPRSNRPEQTVTEAAAQTRELLSAISSLQSQRTPETVSTSVAEAVQFPNVEVDSAFVSRVKEALSLEREQVLSRIDKDKLSSMDADLIDLIGMLFEYMLNDPVLPNVAKALLSHLHTPYLKVALIDRRLLVDSRHPARRLLDHMVEAGSLWVEEGNPAKGMFPAMQEIVDRVLQEFSDDVRLFDQLLESFDQKMREQQRRSDTMEQRTQEAARGREKLTLAKQRAAREIRSLVSAHPVPKPVANFLSRTWLDHLAFILLRDEEQDRGTTWKRSVEVGQRLVGLFDPQASPQTQRARLAAVPELRELIAAAAQRMGSVSSGNVAALLALLDNPETWQSHAMERPEIEMPGAPAIASGTPAPILSAAAPDDDDLSEPERQMVGRLRKMRFGTWFEFKDEPGTPPRRIKLSWMSPLTSTCMFVDRSGRQAEIKSLPDLAQEILAGRARVIPRPKHPFIDRALVSIRKMLQGDTPAPDMAVDRAP